MIVFNKTNNLKAIQENDKQIAKNTLFLYFRMFFLMLISLYTSRVVLNALGVSDFGIYNVVGGVIAVFGILSNSLSNSISRFITFELGRGDVRKLKIVFSTSVNIQIFTALIIVLLSEIIGVWFLNIQMNIPESRMYAANWVFQCSIMTFTINLISIPYNAAIIAHEKMSAFAYISIIEGTAKVVIAFMLHLVFFDKLILYAVMLLALSIFVRFIYTVYCHKHFEECRYKFVIDRKLLRSMGSFAGWTMIGDAAGVLKNYGTNIIANIYCGTIVNAANGIAFQVNNAIMGFSNNFTTAVNPQIIKSYSRCQIDEAYKLVVTTSRLSFMLLFFVSIPIIAETHEILKLWLKIVPNDATIFVKLILIQSLIEIMSLPLVTLQRATGKMKNYQLIVGGLHLMNFPLAWFFLYLGYSLVSAYIITIILAVITLFIRLIMLSQIVDIKISFFIKDTIMRALAVTTPIIFILYFNTLYISNIYLRLITIIIIVSLVVVCLGIKKEELVFVINKIKKR